MSRLNYCVRDYLTELLILTGSERMFNERRNILFGGFRVFNYKNRRIMKALNVLGRDLEIAQFYLGQHVKECTECREDYSEYLEGIASRKLRGHIENCSDEGDSKKRDIALLTLPSFDSLIRFYDSVHLALGSKEIEIVK